MVDTEEATAADTIDLLETRLRRLEYALSGNTPWTGDSAVDEQARGATITTRLAALETDLKKLSGRSGVVQDVLKLYARFPDLFQSIPPNEIPTTLTTANLASIVLSCASAYPETASRLNSLKDLPIPPASASTSLISLKPRLEVARQRQDEQAKEIAVLRARSAAVLERYYEIGLVGGGECWAEYDGRVEIVERAVRRMEVARQQKD